MSTAVLSFEGGVRLLQGQAAWETIQRRRRRNAPLDPHRRLGPVPAPGKRKRNPGKTPA